MSTHKNPKIETVDPTETIDLSSASIDASANPESLNPFDNLDELKVRQDFESQAGVKTLLATVHVKKPDRQTFVRVRPEPEFRRDFACIELREDREIYIVHPNLLPELSSEVMIRTFFTAMTRQGSLFVWAPKVPSTDGRRNQWHVSEMKAAEMAMKQWVRVVPNMSNGANDIQVSTDPLPEPEWPDYSFSEILKVAFEGRPLINSLDHPVVRRLRGKA
jgi:hypothetical protein